MAAWCSMIPMGPNAKDDSGRPPAFDLVVVGGGVNGTAIARDAAGRGLSVLLCEQGDLAGATSSASSKLIHGGLDALERFKFLQVHTDEFGEELVPLWPSVRREGSAAGALDDAQATEAQAEAQAKASAAKAQAEAQAQQAKAEADARSRRAFRLENVWKATFRLTG